jgi:hypothetical protein
VRAGSGVATVLSQLIGAKVIHPRPEDEAYFRDVFEMPAVELKTLRTSRASATSPRRRPRSRRRRCRSETADGPSNCERRAGRPVACIAAHRAVRELGAELADGHAGTRGPLGDDVSHADFTRVGDGILRPDTCSTELDLQTSRSPAKCRTSFAIDADLARQVERSRRRARRSPPACATSPSRDRCARSSASALLTAARARACLRRAAVRNEIERQLAPAGHRTAATGDLLPVRLRARSRGARADARRERPMPTPGDLHLEAEVDRAVENEIDRREQRPGSWRTDRVAQAAGAVGVCSRGRSHGDEGWAHRTLDGRTQDNVQGVVNVGFGIGRREARLIDRRRRRRIRQSLRACARGRLADRARLEGLLGRDGRRHVRECAKWDGAEFPIDYPRRLHRRAGPNPRCEGTYAGAAACGSTSPIASRPARARVERTASYPRSRMTKKAPKYLNAPFSFSTDDSLILADGTIWSTPQRSARARRAISSRSARTEVKNAVKVFTTGYPQKVPVDYEHASTTSIRRSGSSARRAGAESGRRAELKAVLSIDDFTGELKSAAEKLAKQAGREARRQAEPRSLDAVEADRARARRDQGRRVHRALDRVR